MATIRRMAEEVGLLKITCRHCRKKTDYSQVFDELIQLIMMKVASGERVSFDGFGALFAKYLPHKEMVRDGKTIVTEEGLTIRFKASQTGKIAMRDLYNKVKEAWEHKKKNE